MLEHTFLEVQGKVMIKGISQRILKVGKVRLFGVSLVLTGIILLFLTYTPLMISYLNYLIDRGSATQIEATVEKLIEDEQGKNSEIDSSLFVDQNFSILIPKIGASGRVMADVDPYNQEIYTAALKEGIAHAQGSAIPGAKGNSFLFAHSAMGFYDLVSQNVNFYLLNKLSEGDKVYVLYDGEILRYEVEETKLVNRDEVEYLASDPNSESETLTLMTCWPAGTDYKRLIVRASR